MTELTLSGSFLCNFITFSPTPVIVSGTYTPNYYNYPFSGQFNLSGSFNFAKAGSAIVPFNPASVTVSGFFSVLGVSELSLNKQLKLNLNPNIKIEVNFYKFTLSKQIFLQKEISARITNKISLSENLIPFDFFSSELFLTHKLSLQKEIPLFIPDISVTEILPLTLSNGEFTLTDLFSKTISGNVILPFSFTLSKELTNLFTKDFQLNSVLKLIFNKNLTPFSYQSFNINLGNSLSLNLELNQLFSLLTIANIATKISLVKNLIPFSENFYILNILTKTQASPSYVYNLLNKAITTHLYQPILLGGDGNYLHSRTEIFQYTPTFTDKIEIEFPKIDFNTYNINKLFDLWLTAFSNQDIVIDCIIDDNIIYSYNVRKLGQTKLNEIRAHLGKGIKGRYVQFKIKTSGSFILDTLRLYAERRERKR